MHLSRSGYTQTKKWHVGSENSSKTISQSQSFETIKKFACSSNGLGGYYCTKLKTTPLTTVDLYAGWN